QLARVATTQRGMPRRDPSRAPQGAYVVEPDRLLWYTKGEEISACTLDVLLVEHLDDAHPDWDLVPHRACDVATGLLVRGGALGDHGVLVRVAAVVRRRQRHPWPSEHFPQLVGHMPEVAEHLHPQPQRERVLDQRGQ